MYTANILGLLTRQCTTQTFLGFCHQPQVTHHQHVQTFWGSTHQTVHYADVLGVLLTRQCTTDVFDSSTHQTVHYGRRSWGSTHQTVHYADVLGVLLTRQCTTQTFLGFYSPDSALRRRSWSSTHQTVHYADVAWGSTHQTVHYADVLGVLLTRQCTTQTFLGFCRSQRCMFLQIANKVVSVGALRCAHPHSDTWRR